MRKKNNEKFFKQLSVMLAFVAVLVLGTIPVYAAGGADVITNGFNVIYDIIAAVVSAIGTILLLWGVFEWAQSMSVQDGGTQNLAFKRIGGGLIAILGPQLIPLITGAI